MSGARIAIVGAGASGTIQALHLLRRGAREIVLVERERVPGRGTAYGTTRPEHLLNVTAGRMIVFPDDPGHFARWLTARGGDEADYAPRRRFGDYLAGLLEAESARVETLAGEAVAIRRADGAEQVRLGDGRIVTADAVVLAPGNLRPADPPGIDREALGPLYVADPWFGIPTGGGRDETILLIGTGLTAVDAALTLAATGYEGRLLALSRRGLVPRPHVGREPAAGPSEPWPRTNVALLKAVRRRGEAIGWRKAVQQVRGQVQAIWAAADPTEQARFLRHLRPWWDVHRHRIAPDVAAAIAAMEQDGRLAFAAGRIRSARRDGDHAEIVWAPRGGGPLRRLRARAIVNCTGPELDIGRAGDPLLDSLQADGRIVPDPFRLGIHVDPQCRAIGRDGSVSNSLFAIGPVTRGAFWESVAVADISVQAQAVAGRIANG